MDKIFINNLKVNCIIGLHHYERQAKQPIILDLELAINTKKSADTDDIKYTIDYDKLTNLILELCEAKQFKLLEALAEYLCQNIITTTGTDWIRLTITKPLALSATKEVGISIERTKDNYSF